jgi:asparagine synthase (glutamine-hydrolysing)
MCGFGVTNVGSIEESNQFCKKRGPDFTNIQTINGIQFLHNLLHITGTYTSQPFKKNNVACVFNGEIYNFQTFGDYKSDGECLIDLYLEHGEQFTKLLDGEFALCLIDFSTNKIVISTDTFACKPLWFDFANGFAVASYKSQLTQLGFSTAQKLSANTTKIFNLKNYQLTNEFQNFIFDLKQYKNTYDDWIVAFQTSIKKRSVNTEKGMFLGLSSGYDSGAIACELTKQNKKFTAYSIINNENQNILDKRSNIIKDIVRIDMKPEQFKSTRKQLRESCEDFFYKDKFFDYDIKKDQASVGLATICQYANNKQQRIYFSGQGADEILSDYGFAGKRIYKHSSFGGLFPDLLEGFFPWHSFWDGTQIQYLNKEEYVAGHFGIETRYPFLDRDLVQQFLWLSADLKNKKYKNVLAEYLEVNNFPYANEKRGFHVTQKGKN